jgi:hypothetical protein
MVVGRYSPSLSATRSRWPDLTTPVSMMLDRSLVRSLRRLQVHGLSAMAGPSVSQVPGRVVHRKQVTVLATQASTTSSTSPRPSGRRPTVTPPRTSPNISGSAGRSCTDNSPRTQPRERPPTCRQARYPAPKEATQVESATPVGLGSSQIRRSPFVSHCGQIVIVWVERDDLEIAGQCPSSSVCFPG